MKYQISMETRSKLNFNWSKLEKSYYISTYKNEYESKSVCARFLDVYFCFYGFKIFNFCYFRKDKMDYNLAPHLVLHFSKAINDQLEGLLSGKVPTIKRSQLIKKNKQKKDFQALMSLIWCLIQMEKY